MKGNTTVQLVLKSKMLWVAAAVLLIMVPQRAFSGKIDDAFGALQVYDYFTARTAFQFLLLRPQDQRALHFAQARKSR